MGIFGVERKRHRDWSELAEDPRTGFMVGRLMGQVELVVALLSQEEGAVSQTCAESLRWAAAYFVEDEKYKEKGG